MSSYSDAFGRNVALGMSAAAYSNSPEECIARIFPNSGKLVRQVEVDCDDSGSPCAGFIAVDTASKMIIVAFRGSGGFIQLIIEGADEIFGNQVPFIGGKVASYFLNAFSLVWNNGLKDAFLSTKNIYPNYGVFITGHSLGGAMAALAAGAISTNGLAQPSDITLMTMGEPRTGNSDFVYYFDRLGIEAYRITHNRDIVVHLPPEGFNYYQHA
uniref:Lipase_3 domain-containing protein n=1 Tax=Rhabditophanes sp. KR3021 TaxID=114890 RepID=A0AC35TFL3_9BILA